MDHNRYSRPFDPPSPPQERETSPKRKRTEDVSEVNAAVRNDVEAGTRRLSLNLRDKFAMPVTTDHAEDHGKYTTDEEVDAFLQRCDNNSTRARLPQATSDISLNRRLLNSITAAQVTQAQAGRNLHVLSNKLHDWASHLAAQERYLHQQQAEIIAQQHKLTRKLLDAAEKQIASNLSLAESSPQHSEAKQIEQLESIIGVHETNIEILISELMIEKEVRATMEKKLQAKKNTGGTKADSTLKEAPDGNEVDDYVLFTRSTSPSLVPSSVTEDNGEDRPVAEFQSSSSSALSPDKESISGNHVTDRVAHFHERSPY